MDENEELAGLLTEAKKGNESARAALLERLRPRVRDRAQKLLGHRLGARVDGSDIAQDVHLRVWKRFDEFRGDSVPQLLAWLEQIVQNIVTDCNRIHEADRRAAGREVCGSDRIRDAEGGGTTPPQGAVRNERQAWLTDALQRLPEEQQLVFRLMFHEGLTSSEVERRTGVKAGTARQWYRRLIERLRAELGDTNE